jgi:uncharacterized membrane protein
MSDTVETERPHDDAPVTASKKASGDRALIGEAVTINRPARELYDFWREVTNLAEFMDNIESIEPIDGTRSHWVVKAPAGRTVEWDAVITEEREGETIAWASAEGADVANSGRSTSRTPARAARLPPR